MVNRMLFLPEAAVFPDAILVSLSPGKGSEFYPALTGWKTSTSRIQNGYKACKRGMEKMAAVVISLHSLLLAETVFIH